MNKTLASLFCTSRSASNQILTDSANLTQGGALARAPRVGVGLFHRRSFLGVLPQSRPKTSSSSAVAPANCGIRTGELVTVFSGFDDAVADASFFDDGSKILALVGGWW